MRPGTPSLLRGINDRAALDLLLEHGPLPRGRIGELTGLSKPTASQLLTRLTDAGLVVTSGSTTGGPGPRAQLYAVNPDAAHVAGLDVTPGRIHAAVADIAGRTVGEFELPTPRRSGTDAVDQVLHALDGASAAAGLTRRRLDAVAVATPGAFDPSTGRLRYARHLPGWHGSDLLERLAEAVAVPLEVANDVNLAAIAEQHTGVARGVDDFVLLWADDGIGAAVVIDGRVHRGATGGAGEVGFLPLPGTPPVRDVRRGNAGGFQELAGGPQVVALGRAHGLRGTTPQAIVMRALDDERGEAFLTVLAERFALGIAALTAVVDPELVVLSGGVLAAGGERLRGAVDDELGSLAAAHPRLELSSVAGRPALAGALQTALATARDHVFDTVTPRPTPREIALRRTR